MKNEIVSVNSEILLNYSRHTNIEANNILQFIFLSINFVFFFSLMCIHRIHALADYSINIYLSKLMKIYLHLHLFDEIRGSWHCQSAAA